MPPVVGFVAGFAGIGSTALVSAAYATAWGIGATLAASSFGSLIGSLLASTAISALQRALAPKPKAQSQGGGLTLKTTVRGEDNPETIILGWTATGGQAICPPYSHGSNNRYLTHVIELCSAPGAQLGRLMLDDEYVTLSESHDGPGGFKVISGKFSGLVWIRYHDGSQTEADSFLLDRYGAHPERPWTVDMIGTGICYAVLTFEYDQKRMGQVPRCRFEMTGIPLYDLRADSTAGGVGDQRLGDPSTWAPTVNPAVIAWNIKRGIALPGGEIWGGQVDPEDLPAEVWAQAMAACDEAVDDGDDGTEARYRCGIEAPLINEPAAIEEEILKACSGAVADCAGRWLIRVGAPSLPAHSFSDDDVVVSREQELDPFPDLSSTWNAISARYPDPASLWDTRDAPPRFNPDWEEADRFGRKTADLTLPAVPYPLQVQRLMRAWIEAERRFGSHLLTLTGDASHLDPLDTITWISQRNGYLGKDFEISETVEDLRTGLTRFSLREVDAVDYDWEPEFALPLPLPTTPSSPPEPGIVTGLGVAAVLIRDANDIPRQVGLRLSWDDDIIAIGLRWELRLAGSSEALLWGEVQDLSTGSILIYEGLLPQTDYEIRAALVTGWVEVWSDWEEVSTGLTVAVTVAELEGISAPAVPTGLAITSSVQTAPGGGQSATLAITWTAASGAASYDVGLTASGGNEVIVPAGGTRLEVSALPGTVFQIRVRARNLVARTSDWTSAVAHTSAADTIAPGAPGTITITAGFGHLWLRWAPGTEADLHHYEVYEASASTPAPGSGTAATFSTTTSHLVRSGLDDAVTRHYWVRAVDTSGNKSAWSARAQGTTTAAPGIDPDDLASVLEDVANAGIIPANAYAAKSIAAKHMALTDFENLVPDGSFIQQDLDLVTKSGASALAFVTDVAASNGTALKWTNPASGSASSPDARQHGSYRSMAVPGEKYWSEIRAKAGASGKGASMRLRAIFYDASNTVISGVVATGPFDLGTSYEVKSGQVTAPAGAAWMEWSLYRASGTAEIDVRIDYVTLRRANAAKLLVDGGIHANHLSTEELITLAAQIKDAIITSAKIASLSAAKLEAGSALAGSITVSGTALSDVTARANDPAARINGGATLVSPGKIQLTGGTPLSSWLGATDQTKINGGLLETNSVRAASVQVQGGANRVVNGDMLDTSLPPSTFWTASNSTLSWDTDEANRYAGVASLKLVRTSSGSEGTLSSVAAFFVPVTPGEKVVVEIAAKAAAAMSAGFGAAVTWFKANKTTTVPRVGHATNTWNDIASNAALGTAWQVFGAIVEVPPGASFMRVQPLRHLTGHATNQNIWLGRVRVTSAVGTLIEPGSITTPHIDTLGLSAGVITSDRFRSRFLDIDELLQIGAEGALSAGKVSPADPAPGIFFGNQADDFAFAASRVGSGDRQQSISLRPGGFELLNARHRVTGETAPVTVVRTSSLAVTNLPTGTKRIKVSALGGGGGGARGNGGANGGNGGNTVVQLYDGATLKQTITAAGGVGGSGQVSPGTGESSSHGAGGAAGTGSEGGVTSGGNASGYGAGGGGGGGYEVGTTGTIGITQKPGDGGSRGSTNETDWIDLAGYTTPRIAITIGAAGSGAAAATNQGAGGNGSPGRVSYTYSLLASDIPADVVPLHATSTGSFSKPNGGPNQSFPDLGAGLWCISTGGAFTQTNIDILYRGDGSELYLGAATQAVFFSAATPIYTPGTSARTIYYVHSAMGNWG